MNEIYDNIHIFSPRKMVKKKNTRYKQSFRNGLENPFTSNLQNLYLSESIDPRITTGQKGRKAFGKGIISPGGQPKPDHRIFCQDKNI